jgi:two-component system, LytTR family, response regulator
VIRTVIVDDELPARQLMRTMLEDHAEVSVVGEFATASEALQGIATLAPDLVLLDIQMPGTNGLQLAEALSRLAEVPEIVFVTAFDEYAIQAFEVHAVDYLLKPVDPGRLERTLNRVRGGDRGASSIRQAMEALAGRERRTRRLAIRTRERTYLLRPEEVDWLEADGKYVKVHCGSKIYTMRETMKSLEERLDGEIFLRVSRSAIVNLDRVREIQPWFNGDYMILMHGGSEVPTTRGYRDPLRELIERM